MLATKDVEWGVKLYPEAVMQYLHSTSTVVATICVDKSVEEIL